MSMTVKQLQGMERRKQWRQARRMRHKARVSALKQKSARRQGAERDRSGGGQQILLPIEMQALPPLVAQTTIFNTKHMMKLLPPPVETTIIPDEQASHLQALVSAMRVAV